LRDGVVFVDTPGLGSLAVAGAEETHAYLPRCDLGVVLVDAASALTHEDLALALALCQAGANAMILISKADLLNPAERQRTSDYVREHLQIETRLDLPIRLLSVVGADAALCDRWFEEDLRPLLDKHQELADASHRRKIALLRESVAAVLQQRLQTTRPPAAGDHAHRIQAAGEALRRARQALESNRRRADDLARAITALADRILETAAGQIADAWRVHSAPPDAAASVTSSAATVVAGQTGQILGLIEETREQLSEALRQAAGVALAAHDTLEPLPKPAGLPANDFSATRAKVDLEAAGHWRWFGRALLRARLLEELQEQIGDALRAHLRLHSQRLVSWAAQAFAELEIGFTARAEIYHAQFAVLQHSAVPATPAAVVAGDLQSLQQWSPDVSGNKESNLA